MISSGDKNSLGEFLRRTREARGFDLRDAAQQTRINFGYLQAIENDDFSKLPGEVFVRGFLKNYARFLNLSEEDVIKRYIELKLPTQSVPAAAKTVEQKQLGEEFSKAKETPQVETSAKPDALEAWLWGGVAVIALAAMVFMFLPSQNKSSVRTANDAHTSGHLSTASTATPVQKLYLMIEAAEDVWVIVRTDSSPEKTAALKKGETITWSADERFLLSYGPMGAAKVFLNGIELNISGQKTAAVRDLMITAAGAASPKIDAIEKPRKPKPLVSATTPSQPAPGHPAAPMTRSAPPAASPSE